MTDEERKILVPCAIKQTEHDMRLKALEEFAKETKTGNEERDDNIREINTWQSKALLIVTIVTGLFSVIYDLLKPYLTKFLGGS